VTLAPRVWVPICERYDRSLAVLRAEHWHPTLDEQPYAAGILVRPTRLYAAGDVVFDYFTNGQGERWSFMGWSSKRRAAIGAHYLQFARFGPSAADRIKAAEWRRTHPHLKGEVYDWDWTDKSIQHENRSTVRLVPRPDALATLSWEHPDLRRFALSALRAAYSERPVSTNSGA